MDDDHSNLTELTAVATVQQPREPLWQKIYGHLFLILLLSGLAAGVVFLYESGVFDREYKIAQQNLVNVEEANARIYLRTKLGAAAGAVAGILFALKLELRRK